MGTPDFAVTPLRALMTSGHEIICVYTRPPRPKGRGMQWQKSPVHELAESNGIEVRTPGSLRKDPAEQDKFAALKADLAVVAAYGLLLPKAVLEAPRFGCVNIHASLLPRWRGASPIQHALWKGDDKSGVTIMQMEEGLDTGPMILKGETPIAATTTAAQLHDALSDIGAGLIVRAVDGIERTGRVQTEKQDDALATYAPLLKKEDGLIDLSRPAVEIDRQIRALNPWPGAFMQGPKGRLKVLKAHLDPAGALILDLVQPDGKKPMDLISAKNGGYL